MSRLLTVLDATPQQCEMVGFMLRRAVATRTALHTVLFGARPDCDQPEIKLIDVQMVKVRAALEKDRRRRPDGMGLGRLGDLRCGQGEASPSDERRGRCSISRATGNAERLVPPI